MRHRILYLDDHLLVLDKPAGLPVLPDGWDDGAPYLVKALEAEYGRVWIVHRLDKSTSGVIVFARTAEAHRALNRQFEKREVKKAYHALAEGNPAWDERTARHPLRANVGRKHRTVVDQRNGKAAVTHFRVLKRFGGFCLLEAIPETGRTHQVRVHAAALGHPLAGDALYGSSSAAQIGVPQESAEYHPAPLISRPALHARALTFTHPVSGEALTFAAEYPEDFSSALARAK